MATYQQLSAEIMNWDYRFVKTSIGATLFTAWWQQIYERVWNENMTRRNITCSWPDYERTARLLMVDSNSVFITQVTNSYHKTLNEFLTTSLEKAIDSLGREIGNVGEAWQWGRSRFCFVNHIGRIRSFGIGPFTADGAPNTINALSERFGPSWRMIVELGPVVKGYGILPGGQSGNPGSRFYDNMFPIWRVGKLNELQYFQDNQTIPNNMLSTLTLKR